MQKGIEITPGFCILWALLLLTLPLKLLTAAVGAALFHELCHWTAIRLSGGRVMGLAIRAGGMVMQMLPMPPGREMVCALAGPMGSFLLTALYEYVPLSALCALVQGCFNLLPLYPLDGGRAVRCVLKILGREGWMPFVEIGTLLLLLGFVIWIRMGVGPVLAWTILALRKIPCKHK